MEKLTYSSTARTKVASKAFGQKNQKSVASELITALSRPKIKKEIKEEVIEEETKIEELAWNGEPMIEDFQASVVKNLDNVTDEDTNKSSMVKLSNKTKSKAATKKVVNEKRSKEDQSVAFKHKVNTDWINFLKKRQDSEILDEDIHANEIDESPKVSQTQKKLKRAKNAMKKEASFITTTTKVEPKSDKDLILQNLMNQVSQLESSMGANISRLELQLKEEKERSKKNDVLQKKIAEEEEKRNGLEADLEMEKEKSSDIATKLVALQQTMLTTEQLQQKKFDNVSEKLKFEKSKSGSLLKEVSKLERKLDDEARSRDDMSKDLASSTSENIKLQNDCKKLLKWKEDSIIKIKTSIMNCQKDHVQKIQSLELSDSMKGELLLEVSSRLTLIITESSSILNVKNKDIEDLKKQIDVLKEQIEEKESILKEKDKMLKDLEFSLKEKGLKYRDKEESEARYKEKLDRYREKEDRYKEKERKIRDREVKFTELEKRLKEKEKKFKENEEKLKQKEDEMFRVYELVNQLQQRMRNDKINPIVNGQDILSLGKSRPSPDNAASDEDICILPTPAKVSEKSTKDCKNKDSADNNSKRETRNSGEKLDKRCNNDPRKKDRSRDFLSIKSSKAVQIQEQSGNDPTDKTSINELPRERNECDSKSKYDYCKIASQLESTVSANGSGVRRDETYAKSNIGKGSVTSNTRLSKSECSVRESGVNTNTNIIKERVQIPSPSNTDEHRGIVTFSEQIVSETNKNVTETSTIKLDSPVSNKNMQADSTDPSYISQNVKGGLSPRLFGEQSKKRKSEDDSINDAMHKPAKKVSIQSVIEEEEVLLIEDEEDDEIMCVMEIKTSPAEKTGVYIHSIQDSSKRSPKLDQSKDNLKEKDLVMDEEEEDGFNDLPEPVPCVERYEKSKPINSNDLYKVKAGSKSPTNTRMKASDFFGKMYSPHIDKVGHQNTAESNITQGGVELEHLISEQLRLERRKTENEISESFSDSSNDTFDGEIQIDHNENFSEPFYTNPDVSWVLQKWPNMPTSPVSVSEACSKTKSNRGMKVSTEFVQQGTLNEKSILPESSKNLMLPYLWPMAKYVRRDLMKSFDSNSPMKILKSSDFNLVSVSSDLPDDIELVDHNSDEITIGLLYDDLETSPSVDSNPYGKFSTKRSWDKMKVCDLSEERNRILEELKIELDKSRNSDVSSADETFSHLIVSFEENHVEEHPFKRAKKTSNCRILNQSESIVKELMEECLDMTMNKVNADIFSWSDDNFDYECSYIPLNKTSLVEERADKLILYRDEVTGAAILDCTKDYKSKQTLQKKYFRKSHGIVKRYLGSKRCFGRSL